MHSNPLLCARGVRGKRLTDCANPSGCVPTVVDHSSVRAFVASELAEVKIETRCNLRLLAPSLHHAIDSQALVVGCGEKRICRKCRRQRSSPLGIIEEIAQRDDTGSDNGSIGFAHKCEVLTKLGEELIAER